MNSNSSNKKQVGVAHQTTQQTQTYVVKHEFGGSKELTTTLAHAISDVTGVDVTDTGFTLNDYVDPDALDRLFEPKSDGTPRLNGSVNFTIWGYQVSIFSNGQIIITPPQRAGNQGPAVSPRR